MSSIYNGHVPESQIWKCSIIFKKNECSYIDIAVYVIRLSCDKVDMSL